MLILQNVGPLDMNPLLHPSPGLSSYLAHLSLLLSQVSSKPLLHPCFSKALFSALISMFSNLPDHKNHLGNLTLQIPRVLLEVWIRKIQVESRRPGDPMFNQIPCVLIIRHIWETWMVSGWKPELATVLKATHSCPVTAPLMLKGH